MSKISIIYSSIGGNTLLVVQKVAQILEQQAKVNDSNQLKVNLYRVDNCKIEVMDESDCVILASPTYGQGTLESHFPSFLSKIKPMLNGKKMAVIGLGDNRYYPEYLTESGGILEEFVKENNGILLVPALRIGMPPIKFIDKLVPKWVDKLLVEISK